MASGDRANSGTRFSRRWVLAIAFLSVAGLVLAVRMQSEKGPAPGEDDDQELVAENPGYLGMAACAECHSARVKEFEGTRHAHACVRAEGLPTPGFAPGRGQHATRDPSLRFEMFRSGPEYFINGLQKSPGGETSTIYRIDLVYGAAGKSDEMYLAWEEDRLFIHHVSWLYPNDRWGNAADVPGARSAPSRCLECHNTWIAHVPGSVNQYHRDEMILGVTCERCHGPGRDHVAFHREHRGGPARSIAHPGSFDRERRIEVCTQCHSLSFQRRAPPMSYRPGQPLEESVRLMENRYPEEDLVGNQIQYLRQSKCFLKSEMTCVTCHSPHRPSDHSTATASCRACHEPSACREQPKLPEAVRGDCIGCHMPPRVWMGAVFHTSDDQYVHNALRSDHRIAVHPEATQRVRLEHARRQTDEKSRAEASRLAAQLSEHWVSEANRRRADGRLMGVIQALREAMRDRPDPATEKLLREAIARQAEYDRLGREVHELAPHAPNEAIRHLERVLELKPDDAKSHGKLGALHLRLGNRTEAVARLQSVAKFDRYDAFGFTMLARLAVQEGRTGEALELYAQADRAENYDPGIHSGWGQALLRLDRFDEAEQHFRQALTIDPRHVEACTGLSESQRRLGRHEDAVATARKAVRWSNERDVEALRTLAEAYAASSRSAEARATLERALPVAREVKPELVEPILRRLESLR